MQRPATAATSDNAAAFLQEAKREEVLFASLCLNRNRVTLSTGFSGNRALHLSQGNLDSADQGIRREHEIDYAAEFVRHEIAYETGAIEKPPDGGHPAASGWEQKEEV
jgi:hypothetical protein